MSLCSQVTTEQTHVKCKFTPNTAKCSSKAITLFDMSFTFDLLEMY